MTPEQLRNSILQYAMEGKLTKQNSLDETALETLSYIKDEKQQLLKQKKIKKEKYSSSIENDIIVPMGWEIVKIGDLSSVVTKQTGFDYSKTIKPNLKTYKTRDDIPLIQTKHFKGKNFNLETDYYISYSIATNFPKILLDSECLLLSIVGASIGNIGLYNYSESAIIGGAICKVKLIDERLYDFLFYYLQSPYGQQEIKKNMKATAQGTITVQDVREIIVRFPPVEEQKEIVNIIEKLLPLVNEYEKIWNKLEALNKKFPSDMKNSILQYAFEGKLVEQRAEEGTAEELYQQIQEEKLNLIKEGKIKKEKALPEITEDEIPFDIPDSWKWIRLKEIVYNHGQKSPEKTFSYIDIGSINNKVQRLSEEENIVEAEKAPSRARKIVKYGDIIYSTVRPYLHNICIIDKEFTCEPIASTGFAVMSCYRSVYNKFLFYYLLSDSFDRYANSNENAKGVAYPAINDKKLYKACVPLPPLEEQKRIVAKIEELLPLCDALNL